MNPTEVLGEAWQLYKRHWRHLVPIALVVYLLLSLLTLLLVWLFGVFGAFIGAFVSLAGTFWVQGALVIAVQDVRDGRADLTISETLSRLQPRMTALALAGILASIAIGIGFILLIVPGFVLLTWWLFIVPVIVLEGSGVMDSFGRSRELVSGNGWNVFGLVVLTILIVIAAGILITLALSPLQDEVQGYVGNVVSNTLITPFIAAAWTLGYYRLKDSEVAAPAPPAV